MIDPTTAIAQSLGQEVMITSDRYAFEGMVLFVGETALSGLHIDCPLVTARLQLLDFAFLCRCKAVALPLPDFDCRDFDQLFSTAFTNQNGDFIYGWLQSILPNELLDSLIALPAPLAVFGRKDFRDAANLETSVAAFCVTSIVNFISKRSHHSRESIAVNLRQIRSPFVDTRSLQCFPASLRSVVAEIGGNRMGVELRIKLAARVMLIDREDQIAGSPILVRAVLPHAYSNTSCQ